MYTAIPLFRSDPYGVNRSSESDVLSQVLFYQICRKLFMKKTLNLPVFLHTTSAFGTCIQKYVIERYVCLIVFMVIAQTHVLAVATVH